MGDANCRYLKNGLGAVCSSPSLICEVDGQRLLAGVRCDTDMNGANSIPDGVLIPAGSSLSIDGASSMLNKDLNRC